MATIILPKIWFMLTAKTFRTANGYCHILLDKIMLTTSETLLEEAELKESNNNLFRIILYSFLVAVFIAGSVVGFFTDNLYSAFFSLALAGWFTTLVIQRNIYSTVPVIYKSAITKIEFKPFVYSIQNPHFIVHYKYDGDFKKKRTIVLGSKKAALSQDEIQIAINIMEEEFG